MKVYLDVVWLINTLYDFLILASVSILLKRHAPIRRLLLGCLVGMSSICTLFLALTKEVLIALKIVTSLSMVIVTFGPRNLKDNLFYFYVITIIIGGSQYLLTGNAYEVNILTMAIISPIIIYLYLRSQKEYKLRYTKYHSVVIIDGDNAYNLSGYMDTGNTLKDPLTHYPVILVKESLSLNSQKFYYVPYTVVNNKAILKCVKVDKVLINAKEVQVLLGLASNELFIDGVDVILNEYLRELI